MKPKVITITGTPGTGKTALAEIIQKELNFKRIDVNNLIELNDLCTEHDEQRQCKIIDVDKLNKILIKTIEESKENLAIDSHLSHYLPKKYVSLCIVTKCDLKVLKERLERRSYPEAKVRENLDAEIFDNCLTEAEEAGHKIMIVDTTKGIDGEEVVSRIKEKMFG